MKAMEQIKYLAFAKYPDLYDQMLLEEYEDEHGSHFDKDHAMKAVEEMHSRNEDGSVAHGEHWTIEQVKSAIIPYRDLMHENDTCWDAYVALNMWWHDLRHQYKKHSNGNADAWIIEDAMHWAFCDEDAPEGKIWRYIQNM